MIPLRDTTAKTLFPLVTTALVAINTLLFLYQWWLPEEQALDLIYRFAAIPVEFRRFDNIADSPGIYPPLTLITSLFFHAGWLHWGGNMLYLWIFGNKVEERMGPWRFLSFYLFCGAAATLVQMLPNLNSDVPTIGASGAIAGVLGAYFLFFPDAKMQVVVPIFFFLRLVVLPAWLVVGFWVLLQMAAARFGLLPGEEGPVAYYSHVGGFVAGLATCRFFLAEKKSRSRKKAAPRRTRNK